jgi:hypothetical protein
VKSEAIVSCLLVISLLCGFAGFAATHIKLEDTRRSLESERFLTHQLSRDVAQQRGFRFEDIQEITVAKCRFDESGVVEICTGLRAGQPISYRCDSEGCRFDCGGGK